MQPTGGLTMVGRIVIGSLVAGVAFFFLPRTAGAQPLDAICLVDGTALLSEPLGTTPGAPTFRFDGTLGTCQSSAGGGDCSGAKLVAVGSLVGGTCAANNHNAILAIYGGPPGCQLGSTYKCPSSTSKCGHPVFGEFPCQSGDDCPGIGLQDPRLTGTCAGVACAGREAVLGPPAFVYSIAFDDPNDTGVITACPTQPTDTEVSFSGAMAFNPDKP